MEWASNIKYYLEELQHNFQSTYLNTSWGPQSDFKHTKEEKLKISKQNVIESIVTYKTEEKKQRTGVAESPSIGELRNPWTLNGKN